MERHRAKMESDELGELRAWELFVLEPIFCSTGHEELELLAGVNWPIERRSSPGALREEALRNTAAHPRGRPERSDAEESERRGKAAKARVQRGQVSWARQELTGAALAPKNEATSRELRARRPQEQLRQILPGGHGVRADSRSQSKREVVRAVEGSAIRVVSRPRRVQQ